MQPIRPIVFQVAAAPVATAAAPTRLPGVSPWVFVAIMAVALSWLIFRDLRPQPPGPGPEPIPIANVAEIVGSAQLKAAENNAIVMDKIADDVMAKKLTTWKAIQDYARTMTAKGRTDAFAPVDTIDTAASAAPGGPDNQPGVIEGREAAVADYFRKKAEGHRKAAR